MFKYILILKIICLLTNTVYSQNTVVNNTGDVNIASVYNNGNLLFQVPQSFSQNENRFVPKENITDASVFNWVLKFTAGNKVFKDISFANISTGYIVTELGAVYKSTNGGDNWVSVMNLGFPYYWYGVHALTPDTVIIAGFNNQGPINTGVVRWSFNGGASWSSDIVLRKTGNGVGWLDRVHFFNQNTGIVMNALSGGCFVTTTGGRDTLAWSYVTINNDLAWFAGNIDALSNGTIYATGIHFAQSTNFGVSWVSGNSADNVFDGGVDFLDNNSLFGWTGGGSISPAVEGWTHRTTDGGTSWGTRQMTFPYPIRGVKFYNQNTGFAIGGNLYSEAGGIYSTSNGGANWNLDISTSAEMFSLDYKAVSPDSMDVWCVGSTGSGSGYTGKLYKARLQNLTGINVINAEIPGEFRLYQNYPNPFNPNTKIRFDLTQNSGNNITSIEVYDISARKVETLLKKNLAAGSYEVTFDGTKYASGIYFYKLTSGNINMVKKMILVK
ncbi:MAG: T9SS type A sorting domain-containing protein [Ignavibacteria bacterium]